MKVYINYPSPHFTIHRDLECRELQKHQKANQRSIAVNPQNLGDVLLDFINNRYRFAASSEHNDLWLDISLDTPRHDESLVYIIQSILGRNYAPLQSAPIIYHC
jgi:hypothetical protein